jgi:subtilase family serine protease
MLSSVTLHFNLTNAQQADLTQLLADQQNPASPHYHQWLTSQQYGARFGLSSADLAKVQAWLAGKGLKVSEVAPSQNYITVSGSVRQIESAFSTTIHSLSENGERHISNITDPQLPSAVANLVTGITGLNDFKPRAHAIGKPHFTSSTSGAHFVAPGDFYTIYDVNPLLSQNINGTGVSIAIVGQTDISLSDVAAFRTAAGLSANPPKVTQATGYVAGTVSGDLDEAQLDVEWAGAVAPKATINFVTVGASNSASVVDALFYAISNNIAPIISMSYGNCESAWGQSNLNTINQALQQANAQGITFISASGDSGATDCDATPPADYGLTVDFPGSSPFATSAGGTMFNDGSATGTTAYWNSNSSSSTANAGSATGYIPETTWNESSSTNLSSGGGGVSAYFTKPVWQVGPGVPADSSRDVPDLSLNAAANHDGYLFCSQGSCTNGFRNSAGNLNVVGGTSVAAPSLAGIFALLAQQLGGGTPVRLGNINPKLYGMGSSQYSGNVFHDIISGNNNSICQLGTTNCPSGGSIGYSAGSGYDLATGWGTVDVANLANKWSIVPEAGASTGTGTGTGTAISNTTITTTNAVCSITGQLTLSITVANGSASSSLTAPTGTVQILIDGVAPTPASTVQLNNGTATYQLSPSATTGGHTVTAVYSGDGTYAPSKGTLVADFVSSAKADFALTPCTTSTQVTSGATAGGITFTVTPANNFTGPVSFSISTDPTINANLSFSSSSLNVSSGAPATTTLVITATQSTATSGLGRSGASRLFWYSGSAVSFAGILFLIMPTRRRYAPLLALLLSVGAFSVSGCGGGSSNSPTNTGGTTTTNTARGTYILNVTATAANGLVHTSVVTLKVN